MKKITIVLLLVCATELSAKDIVEKVRARLDNSAIVSGVFRQSKTIPIFKKALKSEGDYLAARETGVLWHTASPLSSTTRIRPSGLDFPDQPGLGTRVELQGFGQALIAMLNGDLTGLLKHFSVEGSIDKNGWSLVLHPHSKLVAKAFTSIQLQGNKFPRRIELFEKNGDITLIELSDITTATKLTPAQSRRFE